MTWRARIFRIFARAPLVWAVAGSLTLHAAVLTAIHYTWRTDAPAPIAAQTFAVVTVDAPTPVENAAPAPAPAPAEKSAPPVRKARAEEAPKPPAKPMTPDPRVERVPVFKAPPRKPDPPRQTAEATEQLETETTATEPAQQSAALSPAPATADETGTPPAYGAPGLANPQPRYPWIARQKGEQGRVIIRVYVDELGAAARAEVAQSSGHGSLDRAARRALEQWRFTPARRGGRDVAGVIDVPVTFRLEN